MARVLVGVKRVIDYAVKVITSKFAVDLIPQYVLSKFP